MPIEMLTYEALAARLEISPEAARAVARRLHLLRSRSSDGRTLVSVDVGEIRHKRRAPLGRILEIDALRAEIVQLASTVAMHRADVERERERADRLAAELARQSAETVSVRETTTRLEGALAALQVGLDMAPQGRLGRLTASVVAADRRACR